MSRVAKSPVAIPSGVEVKFDEARRITVKGSKGELHHVIHEWVDVKQDEQELQFAPNKDRQDAVALAGTTRAVINNMVQGVSEGFERRLQLVGVGYRAQAQGKTINLTLGFSHPVNHAVPEGITVETPSNTEIVVRGIDKQLVGEVAAKIRAYRPPEPYKGKGVRYADERVIMKEAKKK
ncbi:50S ribosomal protein L6 [Spiribacter salinus M19-40]|jgi:large subunit ribosomal protein L6|uniref:Large ribosomal subunit protein uL6 n=1 Tax=Spiribacter salinus M19-40 TaxID=1260251 RepID=R4V6M5_9GAMM|nr:50S ribosomal protein L6 [Spiribacter salinus]AGM41574.1 50S ribosomal protein L6 [Spiribacter salinus M19-40]MDR9414144.1 50S ribosomal protein L6 [Spiribacter sp.]MDR9454592.1 50S ribosomal protein L6 [Spiribacter sp.]